MRVTILQPNYIPWRGYFDFIKQSDAFVFYDDVQYTKNDWRNRNLIKTRDGVQWMTIPVDDSHLIKNKLLIMDAKILQNEWQNRHLNLLEENYRHAPYYGEVISIMKEAYCEETEMLSKLNVLLMKKINDYLGFTNCKTYLSSDMGYKELAPTDRLVAICKRLGATEYLSGDAAKEYLEVDKFGDIKILWHRYYEKIYPQLHGEFISRVSIIDTIMNCGIKTRDIV